MPPSEAGRWARRIPSNRAPSRRMALRERSLRESVMKFTRWTRHSSKAWVSMRSFASVLTAVRCAAAPQPGPPDLHRIRPIFAALIRIPRRPRPELDVAEARAADHAARGPGKGGEGQRPPRLLVTERRLDVPEHGRLVGGHRGEAIGLPGTARHGQERARVTQLQRLESHVPALEGDGADAGGTLGGEGHASASFMSPKRSSTFSSPTEARISPGPMPISLFVSSDSRRWEVRAG